MVAATEDGLAEDAFSGNATAVLIGVADRCGDRRNDRCDRRDMIVVPCHQQPTADKIIDASFIAAERNLRRVCRRRDDRMVIGDIGIVHKPPTQRTYACPRCKLRLIGTSNRLHHLRQRCGHIRRQMSAIRAGITEQFFGLVQPLGEFERSFGTESPEAIGVSLQFGKIVKQRRRHLTFFLRH
jgi:hypothetical protein